MKQHLGEQAVRTTMLFSMAVIHNRLQASRYCPWDTACAAPSWLCAPARRLPIFIVLIQVIPVSFALWKECLLSGLRLPQPSWPARSLPWQRPSRISPPSRAERDRNMLVDRLAFHCCLPDALDGTPRFSACEASSAFEAQSIVPYVVGACLVAQAGVAEHQIVITSSRSSVFDRESTELWDSFTAIGVAALQVRVRGVPIRCGPARSRGYCASTACNACAASSYLPSSSKARIEEICPRQARLQRQGFQQAPARALMFPSCTAHAPRTFVQPSGFADPSP